MKGKRKQIINFLQEWEEMVQMQTLTFSALLALYVQRIKHRNFRETGVCTIKWPTITCQAQCGNRSSTGNMSQLPPATPGLFIHPPTPTLSRPLSMAHLHHSSRHSFTHNSFQRLDWTWLYFIWLLAGEAGGVCFISTQTCWNLMDEAPRVKLCFVKEDKDSD